MAEKRVPRQKITANGVLHGFKLESTRVIPEQWTTAYQFIHQKTGARLLHLFNDDPENLFAIAFRTPVRDNTGVPHIIEHSVLCGSRKFPVKDPFQEMLKGSLQTFLNALTYRDKTVYPVASQLEKDFFNLVDVYCDAVFHPLLTEYTLQQEGWHFNCADSAAPISIKGIVYNEMRGVFSDFSSHVARKTVAGLMPDTTYAFESGGEPASIPELTFERFTAFHSTFYHPSNSFIVLYGNIPSARTLAFLDKKYLNGFGRIEPASEIAPQQAWSEPRSLAFEAPAAAEDDGTATVLLAWLFGDSTDPLAMLTGTVLSHYLLGTESSPLRRRLVDSGLGEDLDDMSGFGIEAVQSLFAVGLRKSRPANAEKVQEIILSTLQEQVEKGLDAALLEGALRQVEFGLREIGGGRMPRHLRLAERCYDSWLYGGDPLAHVAFEEPLEELKRRRELGDAFFREEITKRLLDNRHRLSVAAVASHKKAQEFEEQGSRQAAALTASFTADDRRRCRERTDELVRRQNEPPSPRALAALPRLRRADLPAAGFKVPFSKGTAAGVPLYAHPIFTAGIVYFDIGFDLRGVPAALVPYLPLYGEILGRCGAAGLSYEQMATRIALATGGIGTSLPCRTVLGTGDGLFFHLFMHGKSLRAQFGEMLDILHDIFTEPDLANRKQIRDILLEERNGLNASIVGNGHHVALLHASSRLCASRRVDEQVGGVSQLRFLERLAAGDDIDAIVDNVRQLHTIIVNRKSCVVSMTCDQPEKLARRVASLIAALPGAPSASPAIAEPAAGGGAACGIEISAAVNFIARAWRLGAFDPAEYGQLFLLSRVLSTGYLWDKVRVIGGAYGGMSMMSSGHPIFACASYRDPNMNATLAHFEKGLAEIAAGMDRGALDQNVIGAIGRIDQPRPPHARGFGETLDRLSGSTPQKRQALREAVLGATAGKLRAAARKILDTKETSVTILGSAAAFDAAEKQGLAVAREKLL